MQEKLLDMSHGKTRVIEAGIGEPTLLVHGPAFFAGADTWLPVIDKLASRLHVISIDCLNFGPGDVFNQELSFAYLVDHIREVMDVMGIQRANFVGHSGGGWLGTLFGYESPQRLNKLVLVCPGGSRQRNLTQMVDWKAPTEEELTHGVDMILGVGANEAMRQHVYNTYVEKLKKPDHVEAFAKLMAHMTNPMTRERYNTLRRLPHIDVPTLVLWGTDDVVNDLSMGIDVVKGIKGSKMIVYNGVGHSIPQEIPDQFVSDVLDFLAPLRME